MTSFLNAKAFVAVTAMAAIHLASCSTPNVLEQDTTNTFIVVERVQGLQESSTGTPTDELESDVCVNDSALELTCTVLADFGRVEMSAVPKNQDQFGSSFLNDVTFTSYRVTFTRSDGRNTAGVDVPFPFDGATNFIVKVGAGVVAQSFILVRNQAKLEPPLRNLAFGGGALVLSVIAEIEFFGHDGAGRAISAKGFLGIHFADYAEGN